MKLYEHQKEGLKRTEERNRVAYYWDMGSGKTFVGSEKMKELGAKVNLIVCQKSKVEDWKNHIFCNHLSDYDFLYDLTDATGFSQFIEKCELDFFKNDKKVGVINYDLIWRRPELLKLKDFTLLLDESSLIQNEKSKRAKFILKMKPKNVILLSGTPTGGKYERLWSQMHLLGWNISKKLYYSQYVVIDYLDTMGGKSIPIVRGYKNIDRLKRKMREHGCDFLKTEEIISLPEQTFQTLKVDMSKEYIKFRKNKIITVGGSELVGDTTLTQMLYERQLCGQYNEEKLNAFCDLLESTNDRIIVFYNFTDELNRLLDICKVLKRPYSVVNGSHKDLSSYEEKSESITFIQYQAGAMGLNLQKANKIIYFTLPLSSELFEQSKKRVHRIGQKKPCFYYLMICKNSIEEKILKALNMRRDYTERLFQEESEDDLW